MNGKYSSNNSKNNAKYNHTVTEEEVGMTVNQILRANYNFSHRFRTKMKFQELVDLNGTKSPGYARPGLGDVISVRLPEEHSDFPAEDIPLDILYEDDDLILINKQPGITVHPTKGHPTGTLANGLMYYMKQTGQQFKVRFCNRLDMDTSGIIITAKNANAQNELSKQMQKGLVVKKYIALVDGIIEKDEFTIDLPVGRPSLDTPRRAVLPVDKGGKEAVTDVKVLERFRTATLVELSIHTGRTHQIRIHMSHIGHPVIGDTLYECQKPWLIDRQALHSCYIRFRHPATGEIVEQKAPYPEDIKECIKKLRS